MNGEDANLIGNSGLFDAVWYAGQYPDVGLTDLDPQEHYIRIGSWLGRDPHPLFAARHYRNQLSKRGISVPVGLSHYLLEGWRMGLNPHPLFDVSWYLRQYPDVADAGIEPLNHFLTHGAFEGRQPHASFVTAEVFERLPFLREQRINPLAYYLSGKWSEDPCPAASAHMAACTQEKPQLVDLGWLCDSTRVFEVPELGDELRAVILRGTQKARVSVITPTWNRASVIGRAVRSALSQTLPPTEVIVVDDGSSDDTVRMLRSEFAQAIAEGQLVLLEGPRGGVSRARNRGLARASGDYIAYLDSDNEWHRDHLLFSVGALAHNSEADSAYTAVRVNTVGAAPSVIAGERYDRKRMLRANQIDLNGFVHRRTLFSRYGGFDESLRRLVDWEFILRYTKAAPPLFVPVVTVEYYLDASNLGNITFTENLEAARDHVMVKHREEYLAERIQTADQLDRAQQRLLAHRDQAFNVILASPRQRALLPDLSDMDVDVRLWVRKGGRCALVSAPAPDGLAEVPVDTLPPGAYWCPDPSQPMPHIEQLRALYLAVATAALDCAVLSYGLHTDGTVSAACLRNQIVVTERLIASWCGSDRPFTLGSCTARLLRVPPSPGAHVRRIKLSAIFADDVVFNAKHSLLRGKDNPGPAVLRRRDRLPNPMRAKQKPTVLVLPMKVAVGGVERNTVEIMRALRDSYDFIYVTLEKIHEEQGSLAGQVMEVAHRFFDLAEASTHDHYIALLDLLKRSYKPDVVWICNGSMWLCQHALAVREVFGDVPIVDQQVYDVEEGWIRRYTEPGIQSFDRFIAIHSKIRDRFVNDFRMDPARIDLIYSAIDSDAFRRRKRALAPDTGIRAKYGLPDGRRSFGFIGRLVDQKRPIDFLEVAQRRSARHGEHFVLVGNGELAPTVQTWLREHPSVSAQWIPYVENTAEFWSVMDGMLVTSAYEGLPIAMLEALAMGVPVISTDVGDIATLLSECQGGAVVKSIGDPDAFAAQMNDFAARLPAFRKSLLVESERVLDRFSSESIARQYHECWQAAIRQRGRSESGGS